MASEAVEVFISYSHKDEALRQELDAHLKILERQGHISAWHDRKILPGDEWDGEISTYLEQADLILLLVSSDFIASDYCWNIEITRAMARHEVGEAIVVPIILRPVEWKDAPFSKLQAMPKNAKPVITWDQKDLAFAEIASGLRQRAKQLIASRRDQHHQTQKQAALTQYQQKVREYLEDGQLSFVELENLQDLAEQLGLTPDEAEAIKTEALDQRRAYDTKLERYKQSYRQALDHENPLSPDTLARLKERQDILQLQAMDVQQIEQAIYAEWEIKQRQEQESADRLRQEREEVERQQAEAEGQQQATEAVGWAPPTTSPQPEPIAQAQRPPTVPSAYRQDPVGPPPTPAQPANSTFDFETITITGIEKTGLLGLGAPKVITRTHKGQAEYRREDLGNGITLDLVKIPGGRFQMGAPAWEEGRSDNEGPQHSITVPEFWLGKYAVTQSQYQAVMGTNPSHFTENGANCPVEQVSWHEAVAFCKKLSQQAGRTYRLPSEAEWEYACRAGTTTPFHFGATITTDLVNYDGNYTYGNGPTGVYRKQTREVGSFSPNAFGLYDMHGNVWEWCADHWHGNYDGAPIDGTAWLSSDESARRLLRGGSWDDTPRYCRSANRNNLPPVSRDYYIGFRVVCASAGAL